MPAKSAQTQVYTFRNWFTVRSGLRLSDRHNAGALTQDDEGCAQHASRMTSVTRVTNRYYCGIRMLPPPIPSLASE